MKNEINEINGTFGMLLVVGIVIGLMSWLTMFLWNTVLVSIFPTLPIISYWLAVGVYVIISMLFGKS
jgi:hypothetical protein